MRLDAVGCSYLMGSPSKEEDMAMRKMLAWKVRPLTVCYLRLSSIWYLPSIPPFDDPV
jgi:hypothetical protein